MTDPGIVLDFDRPDRIGLDEAIFCSGKSADQIGHILDAAAARSASLLLTRMSAELHDSVRSTGAHDLDYDPDSRTAIFGAPAPRDGPASVAILSGGSSDRRVAREAARTLEFHGHDSESFADIGVAGLWRLQERIERIRGYPILIVVAGMEGALPSVVGGLCPGVVIAVPTSTGYGTALRGRTALFAALTSCAPGVLVTNIDNGYGAAAAAIRVINSWGRGPT